MSMYDNLDLCYLCDGDPQVIQERSAQNQSEEYPIQSQQNQILENIGQLSSLRPLQSFEQIDSYHPYTFEIVNNNNDNGQEVEILDEEKIAQVNLGTTDKISDNNEEIKHRRTSEEVFIQEPRNNTQLKILRRSKKEKEKENKETKNLPTYYYRTILRYVKEQNTCTQVQKKVAKLEKQVKNITMSSLRELLRDEDVKVPAQQYLASYKFLDDLLTSDKQQDIAPPIKYLNKVYQECVQPNSLYNWKD